MFWFWFVVFVVLTGVICAILSDPWDFEDFMGAFFLASLCAGVIGAIGVAALEAVEGKIVEPPIEAPEVDGVVKVEEGVSPSVAVPTLRYDFGEATNFGEQEIVTGLFGGEKR